MAVSDISSPQHRQEQNFWKRLLGQLSRYDLVLAAIPVLFGLVLITHLFVAVSLHVAVGVGAVLSAVLVADALFFHPPTGVAGPRDVTHSTETGDSVANRPEHGD